MSNYKLRSAHCKRFEDHVPIKNLGPVYALMLLCKTLCLHNFDSHVLIGVHWSSVRAAPLKGSKAYSFASSRECIAVYENGDCQAMYTKSTNLQHDLSTFLSFASQAWRARMEHLASSIYLSYLLGRRRRLQGTALGSSRSSCSYTWMQYTLRYRLRR